jgi:hypothetical protein
MEQRQSLEFSRKLRGAKARHPFPNETTYRHRDYFCVYIKEEAIAQLAAVILCSGSRYGASFTTRRFDKCLLRPRNSFPFACCSRSCNAIEFSVRTTCPARSVPTVTPKSVSHLTARRFLPAISARRRSMP